MREPGCPGVGALIMPELGLMTAPCTSFPRRICEIPTLVLHPGDMEDGDDNGASEAVAIWDGDLAVFYRSTVLWNYRSESKPSK